MRHPIITACLAVIVAGFAAPPALAHTVPRSNVAVAAQAPLTPVIVAPTPAQREAMDMGVAFAYQVAAAEGWTDQCPAGQDGQIMDNLAAIADQEGVEVPPGWVVRGLSWYWDCRWGVNARNADVITLCTVAAHEHAHGIRGDSWHSDDPAHVLSNRGGLYPGCVDHYLPHAQPDASPPTVRQARRALRHRLTNPRAWAVTGRQAVTHVRLTARKRTSGTVRVYHARYAADGTVIVTRAGT
jgi:hypothetical protein